MEQIDGVVCEKAVLVGLNADCFKPEDTATYETLDELEALLETAGGSCTAKLLQNRHPGIHLRLAAAGACIEIRTTSGAQAFTVLFA